MKSGKHCSCGHLASTIKVHKISENAKYLNIKLVCFYIYMRYQYNYYHLKQHYIKQQLKFDIPEN